jgi:predicted GIY-YIG superfamily endonuclease
MHTVYILRSLTKNKRYYIGITDKLYRRLQEHNRVTTGYSKRYAPWELATYIVFKDKLLADKFEQ